MCGALRLWRLCAVRAVRALVCVLACVLLCVAFVVACVRCVLLCACACVACSRACSCACFVCAPPRAVCVCPRLCLRRAAPPPGPWIPGLGPRASSLGRILGESPFNFQFGLRSVFLCFAFCCFQFW